MNTKITGKKQITFLHWTVITNKKMHRKNKQKIMQLAYFVIFSSSFTLFYAIFSNK